MINDTTSRRETRLSPIAATPRHEFYETDDSVVNPEVSAVLRQFLPRVFPGKFDEAVEPEMEWTGVMGYTKSHEPFVRAVLSVYTLERHSLINA